MDHAPLPAARIVRLAGELTIYCAAEQREFLLNALRGDAPVHLDLAAVTAIDSAGVQLLAATRRSTEQRGQALSIGGAPDQVNEILATLGLPALPTMCEAPASGAEAA